MTSKSRKCTAKAKSTGEQCANWPAKGSTVCRFHGGAARQVKAKAKARLAQEEAQRAALRALGDDSKATDPAEALLWLVTTKAAEVRWLRGIVQQFEPQGSGPREDGGLIYGLTKHEDGLGPEGPIDKKTYEVEQNIWWQLLHKAEAQLADYAAKALKAGIQQQELEIKQATAALLATAITRILDGLQLTAAQAKLVPTIVPEILRSLPTGDETTK